ncbi:DUF7691 family protein [Streptomyces avicenniae]|uniref:DUF7691 family protein n=1 Tax=Streptomyces avicenniae TaxID=500153 RepID=UPI00069A0209|nr:hypothetical protein [Streptomyces avicenniae]
MSSSLSVYLLDIAATRALVGSRDDELLAWVRAAFPDLLAQDDDYFSHAIEQGAPTASEALHAVVHGGPFSENRDHAFTYGYAYKRLCSLTGRFLDNNSFTPHRGDWLSMVDEGLKTRGVTAVSVADFGYGSLPSPLPWADAPSCGEWAPEHIAEALRQYEAGQGAVAASGQASALEPAVEEAVTQCLGWIRMAAAKPGFGVIGFRF